MTPEEKALATVVRHLEALTTTVLSKLEWARKSGGSEKQLADVAGVLEIQGDRLDVAYVERWARELGVLELWQHVSGRRPPKS